MSILLEVDLVNNVMDFLLIVVSENVEYILYIDTTDQVSQMQNDVSERVNANE